MESRQGWTGHCQEVCDGDEFTHGCLSDQRWKHNSESRGVYADHTRATANLNLFWLNTL